MATAIIPFRSNRSISRQNAKRKKQAQPLLEAIGPLIRKGDHIVVRRNLAPWWTSPELGDAEDLTIESIRDCVANPLTFEELVSNISANIGQYLATCYCPKLRSTRQVFLNDCRIEEYSTSADDGICFVEEASPIVAYGLSFGFHSKHNKGGWVNKCEQSGPSIEERLLFVENVSRALGLVRPEHRAQLFMRPIMERAKVVQ